MDTNILLESGTNELEVLEFTLGDNHYGINVAKIREILQYTPVTPVPNSHPSVEGIFMPRDTMITVIDLKKCLGLPETDEKGLFIIIVLHHHIISIPNTGRERNILSDAGDILLTILENNVNLVLSGHKHVPHAWKMNNTLFATAGTVSSMKLRGNTCPSYNVIDINNQYIEIMLHNSNGTIKPLRHP